MADQIRRVLASISNPTGLTVAAGIVSRVITGVCQLFVVRMLLGSLKEEVYAGIVLMTALLVWFMLADFGSGAAIQNTISERRAMGRPYFGYVRLGVVIGIFSTIALSILIVVVAPWLAPIYLAVMGSVEKSQVVAGFILASALLVATGASGIGYRIWFTKHKGYLAHITMTISCLVSVVWVWIITREGSLSFTHAVLATLGPGAAASFIVMLMQLKGSLSDIGDDIDDCNVIRRAGGFFLFGLQANATLRLDYMFMVAWVPAYEIILYNINERIFGLLMYCHSVLLQGFYPRFTEAITLGDWATVSHYIKKILIFGLVFMGIIMLITVEFFPLILKFLDKKGELQPDPILTWLFGFYMLVGIWVGTFSTIQQSMSDIKWIVMPTPIMTGISICLMYVLVPIYGARGILIALILSHLIMPVWMGPVRLWFLKNRAMMKVQ